MGERIETHRRHVAAGGVVRSLGDGPGVIGGRSFGCGAGVLREADQPGGYVGGGGKHRCKDAYVPCTRFSRCRISDERARTDFHGVWKAITTGKLWGLASSTSL